MLQYVLRFVAGKDQGREFPLPPDLTIVIGRVSDVDMLMLDKKVSRKHARIATDGGRIVLDDLASRNGTFVNGLKPKLPRHGAQLAASESLPANLRDLATEETQLFQLILHHNRLESVIDSFPGTDFEAYTCLLALMRRGFVTFGFESRASLISCGTGNAG
jgi:hypothetical protein